MKSNLQVVVIAASMEGIDALARLISQLPDTFALPVVAHVHGLRGEVIVRLKGPKWRSASRVDVVYARDEEHIHRGCVYVVPADEEMVFDAEGSLRLAGDVRASSADRLFESAARRYQAGVVGVVLSGLGTDGTTGLQAITQANGVRIIQSPSEATFSSMPFHALLRDHIQYSVLIDELGPLLLALTSEKETEEVFNFDSTVLTESRVLTSRDYRAKALDRSIVNFLGIVRDQLHMDIVLVTKNAGDDIVISHSEENANSQNLKGELIPKTQSLCQRVLDGHLPAIIPDLESMRLTHDVPATVVPAGAYMAAPIWLQDGNLFGTLCCLNADVVPELSQRHYQRLEMSARQIAKLINEAELT